MARPITLTTTDATGAATTSAVWQPDTFITPFNLGVMIDVTGTVDVDIEITLDDPGSASALWRNHATFTAKTADLYGAITEPCRGVKMVQNSGSGSCRAVVIQAG